MAGRSCRAHSTAGRGIRALPIDIVLTTHVLAIDAVLAGDDQLQIQRQAGGTTKYLLDLSTLNPKP